MQQSELIEIGILDREAIDNFKKYETTKPTGRDIKIYECRQYNLELLAEENAKREYWQKVKEARAYNLALIEKNKSIALELRERRLLEMLKIDKSILSSVR